MRRWLSTCAVVLVCIPANAVEAKADLVFTDWTNVNTTTDVAVGTLGPVSVTVSGGVIDFGVTDGSFTGFNYPYFTPPLAMTDVVEFKAANPPATYTYTVSFSGPITNPVLQIGSLASILTFSTAVTRLSGQADFVVAGNTVTGAYHEHPANPTDSNGTVELLGTLSSFTFTAQGIQVFSQGGDGIDLQIGADVAAVPEPGSLALCVVLGLGLLGIGCCRQARVIRRGDVPPTASG
jgi:hypothetical protein